MMFIDLDGAALSREPGDRVSVTNCSWFAAQQRKELLSNPKLSAD
jgi:hypothetical protein